MSFCSKLIANFSNASRTAASSAAYAVAVDLELATKATSPTKTIAHAIAPPPPSMLLRFFIRASPVRRYTGLVELNKCFKTFRGLANRYAGQPHMFWRKDRTGLSSHQQECREMTQRG